jgi:hypothetical protein
MRCDVLARTTQGPPEGELTHVEKRICVGYCVAHPNHGAGSRIVGEPQGRNCNVAIAHSFDLSRCCAI